MYRGAVRAFLAGHGVRPEASIRSLEWRAGEWPGRLRIELADGRLFEAPKFYYNYLTPFYLARNTLITPDFTNELADVSVGDAWLPELEAAGGGHCVVIARSEAGRLALEEMRRARLVKLEEIPAERAIAMHAHMIDFKKRGAFLRLERERRRGRAAAEHRGYELERGPHDGHGEPAKHDAVGCGEQRRSGWAVKRPFRRGEQRDPGHREAERSGYQIRRHDARGGHRTGVDSVHGAGSRQMRMRGPSSDAVNSQV